MTNDEELRAAERAVREDEPGAVERYMIVARRALTLDAAIARFLEKLNAAMLAHYRIVFDGLEPPRINVDRSQGPRARKNVRIVRIERDGASRSVYCFVETATGTILKPGGWKAPEPARYPRGNVYACDPLRGCGPHGTAYVTGIGSPWAAGVFASGPVPVRIGPTLPGIPRR